MTLHPELIRVILERIETQACSAESSDAGDFTSEAVDEHRRLLIGAGYVDESAVWSGGPEGASLQLTWKGQDFLDASRDDAIWRRAKDLIRDKGVSLMPSFRLDILNGVLTGFASDAVRHPRMACR